jgi:hypothetical protein
MTNEPTAPASDDSFPPGRAAGFAIGVPSVLTVAFMAFHPTVHHHDMTELVSQIADVAARNAVVHGSLIGLVGVLVCGFSCLASRLGMNCVSVRGGLVAYILGAMAGVAAALVGGFIYPALILHYQDSPAAELETLKPVLILCGVAIHICSQLWIMATSMAVICWSIRLVRRPGLLQAVGVLGWIVGGLPVIALSAGHFHMNVHGVLAFVLGQAIWNLAISGLLIRGWL